MSYDEVKKLYFEWLEENCKGFDANHFSGTDECHSDITRLLDEELVELPAYKSKSGHIEHFWI